MKWQEIKKWAKDKNLDPKKSKEGIYSWKDKTYSNLDLLVKDLWNEVSNNKWLDYQENYEEIFQEKQSERSDL